MLCLTPTYLVVFDDLHSESSHRYDWVYHQRAAAVACPAAVKPLDQLAAEYPGQEYLQDLQQGPSDQPIRVQFSDSTTATLLLAAAGGSQSSEPTIVTTGNGVGGSVVERIPLSILTRQGRSVQFAAVLVPVQEGAAFPVDGIELQSRKGTYQIRISRGQETDLITLDPQGNTHLEIDGQIIPWQE